MPPRLPQRAFAQLPSSSNSTYICSRCSYATAVAPVPAPSPEQMGAPMPQLSRHHPLQPPSHRSPAYRKSQMLRSYVSLLQTTPLMLFFQHNNLRAMEWASIRRELSRSLTKTDASLPNAEPLADAIKLQVIQTNMFEPALRITEYYDPSQPSPTPSGNAKTDSFSEEKLDPSLTHVLSTRAYAAVNTSQQPHPLTTLLNGSLAVLTFPSVSPQHVASALSVLSPQKPRFPAPTRRAAPSYHEPAVQDGLKKLMLLGARVDGQVFDEAGVRWVGGIEGGMDGLRAQLVMLLQNAGVGLAGALEGLGKNLWLTMESRRQDMEEKAGGGGAGDGAGEAAAK
ncbi:uncharacterized protein HMPREF1541_08518 [Cyphellophora europaea CBS 101466]|uniref:Uncharacterized protein n=1 Tax=Cyphellophora europaea (strain CBS 101466) TaxID=1220924 RepID=W2RID0_CYPE1|nr:uncharacterized protein HMPREF1541_08518 [Cyphellophora europaea CBS 101466]ETN36241.1 hypothetical protein HMPREF1541_08518 [Cyphellophora europaea CBS 101466]